MAQFEKILLRVQRLTWRLESIHHKVQWSSVDLGAHEGMISGPLWDLKKKDSVKTGQLFERSGGLFSLYWRAHAPYLYSPLAGPHS